MLADWELTCQFHCDLSRVPQGGGAGRVGTNKYGVKIMPINRERLRNGLGMLFWVLFPGAFPGTFKKSK